MSEDYRPIPCASHEQLEVAVLKKQWLEIKVKHGEHAGTHTLLPLDVYAHAGEEWLEAQTEAGERLKLRLDWIAFN